MTEQLTLISTTNIKKFLPINEKRHIKLEKKTKILKHLSGAETYTANTHMEKCEVSLVNKTRLTLTKP